MKHQSIYAHSNAHKCDLYMSHYATCHFPSENDPRDLCKNIIHERLLISQFKGQDLV